MPSEQFDELLESPLSHPQILDDLWRAYDATKEVAFVLKIVSVLDLSDRVRTHMEAWLEKCSDDELERNRPQLIAWSFPISYHSRTIDGPVDLDLHVALLAKSRQLQFKQLPIQIPVEDLIRLSIKSAALWSLLSVAGNDSVVAGLCLEQAYLPGGAARPHLARAGQNAG